MNPNASQQEYKVFFSIHIFDYLFLWLFKHEIQGWLFTMYNGRQVAAGPNSAHAN
jgi:hypothetical protein